MLEQLNSSCSGCEAIITSTSCASTRARSGGRAGERARKKKQKKRARSRKAKLRSCRALKSDHGLVAQSILLDEAGWNAAEMRKRAAPKHRRRSIPEERLAEFTSYIQTAMQDINPADATLRSLTTFAQHALRFGKGRGLPYRPARHSETESRLTDAIRMTTDDAVRRDLHRELFHNKPMIQHEKDTSMFEYVLNHTQNGGWGKSVMTTRLQDMPWLELTNDGGDTEKVSEEQRIA